MFVLTTMFRVATKRAPDNLPELSRPRLLAGLVGLALGCAKVSTSRAAATTCVNEQLRQESDINPATGEPYSLGLPYCRAYELVSTSTESLNAMADPKEADDVVTVGASGNEVVWRINGESLYGNPQAGTENLVLAHRGAAGWSQFEDLAPPGYPAGSEEFKLADATNELSGVALAGQLVPGVGPLDYVVRDAAGSYVTIATNVLSGRGSPDQQLTLSADGTHAFLTTLGQLAGDTHTSGHELYEWTAGGGLRVFAVDDAGQPLSACGAILGGGDGGGGLEQLQDLGSNPVSLDGSRVFFTSPDPGTTNCGPGELYVRENDATTVEISKAPPGAAECELGRTECGATFAGATPDGSKVFFITRSHLTPDKADSDPDLYEYNVKTGALTRLSVGPPGHDDANIPLAEGNVGGFVDGLPQVVVSRDGSHVYFIASGQLVPGKGVVSGEGNLYLYANGKITYITTLATSTEVTMLPSSFLTPEGSDLVFLSTSKLTSYDNEGHTEIYRYDAPSAILSCVSCNPSGAPPSSSVEPSMGLSERIFGPIEDARAVSEDGSTIFFVSAEDLVPAATNHEADVYEWHDGRILLISSGTSPYPDYLLGMSASGSDVFFMTHDQLVPQDGDESYNIYDARVDGGIPAPSTPVPCASAETCRSALATPPVVLAPASASFLGSGDLVPSTEAPAQPKSESRSDTLKKALRVCKKDKRKKKRATCEKTVRMKYGPRPKTRK